MLSTFYDTLGDEELEELNNSVEITIIDQLSVAADGANLSGEEAQLFKQMMIEEEGDLMLESLQKPALMKMMLKAVENGEFEMVPR